MIGEGILKKGATKFTPKTLTCPLKSDYFKGKIVFQPLFFAGTLLVLGGVVNLSLNHP